MIILGIDPGNVQSAYCIWDGKAIWEAMILPNDEALVKIAYIARRRMVDHIAIEQIKSYGMSVGESIFETCVWTGRFMEAIRGAWGSLPARIPRIDIKVHLCHSARAKDGNVRQALIDRIGIPGTKKTPGPTYGISADKWAALAVAVTAYDRLKCGFCEPQAAVGPVEQVRA